MVHLSAWMDRAILPPGSLSMVAALCGVGENWMVQSWWGHGSDADGGWHSWQVHRWWVIREALCVVSSEAALALVEIWVAQVPSPRKHMKHG